jgi:hypothetical protein
LLDVFVAIHSETDAFPIGKERALWNVEALARKDKDRLVVEQRWRNRAVAVATQLVYVLEHSE